MHELSVMDLIKSALTIEIKNDFTFNENEIIIKIGNKDFSIKEKILNHDFGYGKNIKNLNKLEICDLSELKCYLSDLLEVSANGRFNLVADKNLLELVVINKTN